MSHSSGRHFFTPSHEYNEPQYIVRYNIKIRAALHSVGCYVHLLLNTPTVQWYLIFGYSRQNPPVNDE